MFSLLSSDTTMDGNVFPDQEQLLGFLKKLKEVFDVCDEDADGYIRVEHLVDLGLQFGQGDEVKKFAKYLDPNAHGRINFKDFCHGVFAIKGCEGILKTALGTPQVDTRPYETDNGYYYQIMHHSGDCLCSAAVGWDAGDKQQQWQLYRSRGDAASGPQHPS
ncbi:rab11 family-interacting protein 4A-like [Engraulis encrasicolus]|uniref:rab11 family-interacting protein 4A-like n=1 Tax=Engraulis encrasicolus TaxID=184585 RepID=UPI002FCF483B